MRDMNSFHFGSSARLGRSTTTEDTTRNHDMKTLRLFAVPIRFACERERRGILLRMWWRWAECAYIVLGVRGVKAEIEFPSDWNEERMGWVRIGLGIITIAFAFPWKWTVPDEGQCSGPTYGFAFFDDLLFIRWGKSTGRSRDPRKYVAITMPWGWRHREHEVLGEPESHPYRYVLRGGEVQERIATIKAERRLWTRPWLPHKRESRYIDIEFNNEVGERTGSWKGGVLGCSYDMLPGDTPLDALRRMEAERRFT